MKAFISSSEVRQVVEGFAKINGCTWTLERDGQDEASRILAHVDTTYLEPEEKRADPAEGRFRLGQHEFAWPGTWDILAESLTRFCQMEGF
jgi:hypothetical protein